MEEIIKYILDHFGISKEDLKPSLNPKPINHKARVIIAKFLKNQEFRNHEITKQLFTTDVSVIFFLIKSYTEDKYPELIDLHRELSEKFGHIKGEKLTFVRLKKCAKCKQEKENQTNFERYNSGRYSVVCNHCKANPVRKPHKTRVVKVKIKKLKLTPIKPISIIKTPSIEELKSINNKREQELFSQGKRFVKSTKHLRAYVLPKV